MADWLGVDVSNSSELICSPARPKRIPNGLSPMERVLAIGWDVDPDSGCWEWRGERGTNGRARIYVGRGVRKYPYRLTYEHIHGPIPPGLLACHTCDNPGCVNPDHIQPGTAQDNVDMIPRSRRGFRLSADVEENILFLYGTGRINQSQLARAYGVDQTSISRLVRGARATEFAGSN